MKVKFRTNLGSRDATEAGIDHTQCVAGKTVNVPQGFAEYLAKRGIVEPLADPETPKEIKAVPDAPAIADAQPATVVAQDEKKPSGKPGKTSKDKD